jgi:hypothetical protein
LVLVHQDLHSSPHEFALVFQSFDTRQVELALVGLHGGMDRGELKAELGGSQSALMYIEASTYSEYVSALGEGIAASRGESKGSAT